MNRPSVPVTSCEVSWGPKDAAIALLDGPASRIGRVPVRPSAGRQYRIAGAPHRARRLRFHRDGGVRSEAGGTPTADEAESWLAEVSASDASEYTAQRTAAQPDEKHEASAPPKEKGLLHYLGTAVSAALLLLVLGVAALVIAIPAVVGGQALTVLTQSMEPGLPPGTLIVIKPTPAADIRIGDVITYQIASDQPAVVSHRVMTKSIGTDGETTFTTKGDNNDLVDQNPVMEVQVRGTLWYSIPYLGWVNNAVNGDARTFIVPIAAGGLFLYALYMFGGSVRERIRKRRIVVTA